MASQEVATREREEPQRKILNKINKAHISKQFHKFKTHYSTEEDLHINLSVNITTKICITLMKTNLLICFVFSFVGQQAARAAIHP